MNSKSGTRYRFGKWMAAVLLLASAGGVAAASSQPMAEVVGDEIKAPNTESVVPQEVASILVGGGVLYDNGAFINGIDDGCNGLDSSSLEGLDSTFGWNTLIGAFRLADDFTVPTAETWDLDTMIWRVYQTNSSENEQITTADVRIYDGNPALGGALIDENLGILVSSQFTGVYRDNNDAGCARAIKDVAIDMSWLADLPGGTYWVEVATLGSPAFTGPWGPPTTPGDPLSDNGLSFDETTGLYVQAFDSGSGDAQDFPFLLVGSASGGHDFVLNVNPPGVCPGAVRINITGGTPFGQAAILVSAGLDAAVIPAGPCAGTETGLAPPLRPVGPIPLDDSGNANLNVVLPSAACGQFMQALDVTTCIVSNVVGPL